MLGWSINLFRVFGIQLAVHASFLLLLVYAGYEGWSDSGGLSGLLWGVGLTLVFFVCVILHELGHSLTAKRFGVRVPRILLLPIGGMAEFDHIPSKPSEELLITVAGPAVNFVIALVLLPLVGLPAGWPFDSEYPATFTGFGQLLLGWNLLMGTFNLLPVFPMDGGRILRALLATRMPYLQATYRAVMVGRWLAVAFALIAAFYYRNPLTFVLFVFIAFAGNLEYRQLLRREEEARYWEEMAKRALAARPVDDDLRLPPVILHGPN